MTFPIESRSRLVREDNYVLVIEEVYSSEAISDMFSQVSVSINDSEALEHQLKMMGTSYTSIPFEFAMLHYYDDFVSPSNFQGCALVVLLGVPDKDDNSLLLTELMKMDELWGRIVLIAVRNDETRIKFNILKEEAERMVQARTNTLRNLENL